MTPAINLLKKKGISHKTLSYSHDKEHASYGLEAAEQLNLEPARVYKTLLAELDNGDLVVTVLPVSRKLNLKTLAQAAGVKKAAMAAKEVAERISGSVIGGISPLGLKKQLRTYLDDTCHDHDTIYISAGRRGLEIELKAEDLEQLTRATILPLGR